MAALAVFETPELLEWILYELPTKDLLFAQKVCKHFKAVIEGSLKLQQALFYKNVHSMSYDASLFDKREKRIIRNPLLQSLVLDLNHYQNVVGEPLKLLSAAMEFPSASWRKMLPVQPAMTGIFEIQPFFDMDDVEEEFAEGEDSDGKRTVETSGVAERQGLELAEVESGNLKKTEAEEPYDKLKMWLSNFVWCEGWRCWTQKGSDDESLHASLTVGKAAISMSDIITELQRLLDMVPLVRGRSHTAIFVGKDNDFVFDFMNPGKGGYDADDISSHDLDKLRDAEGDLQEMLNSCPGIRGVAGLSAARK